MIGLSKTPGLQSIPLEQRMLYAYALVHGRPTGMGLSGPTRAPTLPTDPLELWKARKRDPEGFAKERLREQALLDAAAQRLTGISPLIGQHNLSFAPSVHSTTFGGQLAGTGLIQPVEPAPQAPKKPRVVIGVGGRVQR